MVSKDWAVRAQVARMLQDVRGDASEPLVFSARLREQFFPASDDT